MPWDGLTHRALLDGVEVVAGVLRNPGTIFPILGSLFIRGDGSAARWTIHDLQYRLTKP